MTTVHRVRGNYLGHAEKSPNLLDALRFSAEQWQVWENPNLVMVHAGVIVELDVLYRTSDVVITDPDDVSF
jgi:hypothetical protein